MNNNDTSAGNKVDSSTKADLLPSAPLAANPMLVAGYPRFLSNGIIKTIAVGQVNGYEIINESIPRTYNDWYLMEGMRQVSIKDEKGNFKNYPHFENKQDAIDFANSLPSACR